MYVAMLLTNWYVPSSLPIHSVLTRRDRNVISAVTTVAGGEASPIKIGRSHIAMWMRIVSSWACLVIYAWTLVAPVIFEGRDF